MKNYAKHVYGGTPQTEKVHGVDRQATNNAGGIAFTIDRWDYLMRFLILGTEGGTFYVDERKLTVDAANSVRDCLNEDGRRTVDTIVNVSVGGRAATNDAAIFALAMASSHPNDDTRGYALRKVSEVCRIGTHLFSFIGYAKQMRGIGPGLRKALARWYTDKPVEGLAYQLFKYQQRDGWSNRDVLRLCHAIPKSVDQNKLFAYAVGKQEEVPVVSPFTEGINELRKGMDAAEAVRKYRLVREVLPTESLKRKDVWEALLENMPMHALVRNLGKMASIDLHTPLSETVKTTVEKLTDEAAIKKSRLHPISIMNAKWVYDAGHGFKGNLAWKPNSAISGALEDAFYKSFNYVEPTGKRIMIALDVSGSMGWCNPGSALFTCRDASAVLAMTTVRTEEQTFVTGFQTQLTPLNITKRDSLKGVVKTISGLNFGRTDCAQPMIYCQKKDIDLDAIVIYTDSETWAGSTHPWQALDAYKQKVGHEVKVIVVGMVSNGFTIARPDYVNMLDIVGFDTNTPAMISEFIRG